MSSFKDWTVFDLEQTFGLKKQSPEDCTVLQDWLNVPDVVDNERINIELDDIRSDLTEYADIWNEEELKGFFVFPLLRLVRFKSDKYKVFYERKLSVKLNDIELKGDVDAMIASGTYNKIIAPFYCMQEYKPESRKSVNDVRGQLLVEMLAAQTINANDAPVYGSYLNGRFWFFATLIGNRYCFSNGLVADSPKGLAHIFNCLLKLKAIIDERVANI
jgi:hypothetical protein